MNFSEFSKTKMQEKAQPSADNSKSSTEIDQEKVEDMVNKYSDYSQSELMDEFVKLGKSEKAKGALNDSKVNNIKEVLSPYLSDEQKKYFDELIKKI